MAEKMKYDTVNGQYRFLPEEYLQPSQIRSLLTKFKKETNQHPSNSVFFDMPEDDGIEAQIDEICNFALYSDEEEDFIGFDSEQ